MSSLLNTPEVSVIGLGFVGGSMFRSFKEKGASVFGYDKYKKVKTSQNFMICLIKYLECFPRSNS